MKDDTNKKLYEIAYFISPDMGDEEAVAYTATIKNAITKADGEVQKEEPIHKRRLAHPLKNKKQGYFGYMHFVMSAEKVQPMSRGFSLDTNILRHLIISVDTKQIAQMQKPAQNIMAQEKVKKTTDKEAVEKAIFKEGAVSAQEEKKVEIEELDKKLEEILNK